MAFSGVRNSWLMPDKNRSSPQRLVPPVPWRATGRVPLFTPRNIARGAFQANDIIVAVINVMAARRRPNFHSVFAFQAHLIIADSAAIFFEGLHITIARGGVDIHISRRFADQFARLVAQQIFNCG